MKKLLTLIAFCTYSLLHAQAPSFQWAKGIGEQLTEYGNSMAIDNQGNIYITGDFSGVTDFDPNAGTVNLTSNGSQDICVAKYNPAGNLIWAKGIGGSSGDGGASISLDGNGNIYCTGSFADTVDFDPGAGVFNLVGPGTFITKLDPSGNFIWAKCIKSASTLYLKADNAGNFYLTGYFTGTVDFDPNAGTVTLSASNSADAFICKFDTQGNLTWCKNFAGTIGSSLAWGYSVLADPSGNVYSCGHFTGTVDFDPNAGTNTLTSGGNYSRDAFISKLDASGNLIWAKQTGSTTDDKAMTITMDGDGNLYFGGYFTGTVDFDPNAGITNITSNGAQDIFVTKIDPFGNFLWVATMGGTLDDRGFYLCTDIYNDVYISGYYSGTADFDPGLSLQNLISVGSRDIFACKLNNSGNFVWAKSMGGPQDENAFAIIVDVSGNVYSIGYFESTADFDPDAGIMNLVSNGNQDIFIQKMNQPAFQVQELNFTNDILVYPNPSNGLYNIDIHSITEITVINLLGEIVLTGNLKAGKQIIDLQNQPSGIYFVQAVSEGKQQVSKLVKN